MRGKPFGSPDGPDPKANGVLGAAERERRRLDRIGETLERLELHADKAATTLVDLLDAEDPRLRLRAATTVLERVLGPVAKEASPPRTEPGSEVLRDQFDEWWEEWEREQKDRQRRLETLEKHLGEARVREILADG